MPILKYKHTPQSERDDNEAFLEELFQHVRIQACLCTHVQIQPPYIKNTCLRSRLTLLNC